MRGTAWGGSRMGGSVRFGSVQNWNRWRPKNCKILIRMTFWLKKRDLKTPWLGLKTSEIAFPRTWIFEDAPRTPLQGIHTLQGCAHLHTRSFQIVRLVLVISEVFKQIWEPSPSNPLNLHLTSVRSEFDACSRSPLFFLCFVFGDLEEILLWPAAC